MTVGVIAHLHNPDTSQVRRLAQAAEDAGAAWLGVADAFWWRDVWVLLAEAARATSRIELGPVVTNPYLRHPFHTLSALATVQEIAGPRVFLGLGAGGSEVPGAAGTRRREVGRRIAELADLTRSVASGAALDPASGRRLEVALLPAPVLVAGRGDAVLAAAGRAGDRALLWAVPTSDLARSASVVAGGASEGRSAPGALPELVWAPLVAHDDASAARIRTIAAYSVLNSRPELHRRWGLDLGDVAEIRRRLVGGGAEAAMHLVPPVALTDLVIETRSPLRVAEAVRGLGVGSVAVPAFDVDAVAERVAWATAVLGAIGSAGGDPSRP